MRTVVTIVLTLALFAHTAVAEWTEPANGAITDQQLTQYLGAMRELSSLFKAAGQAAEGQKNTVGAIALWSKTSEKYKSTLEKHKLSEAEFNWLSGKVTEAWLAAVMELNWEKNGKPGMEGQEKKMKADLEVSKANLAKVEAAAKDGKRLISDDDRKWIVERAKEEQDQAQKDIADGESEIKRIKGEITKTENEAKEAEKLAANPPADVEADARKDYVDGKKQEAADARETVKSLTAGIKENEKFRDEATQRLAAAKAKAANPEVPTTEEEKKELAAQNESTIKALREAITTSEQSIKLVSEVREQSAQQITEISKNTPRGNVELLKNRYGEFCDAMGVKNDFAEEKK